jgi:hypothetical protein
MNHCHWPKLIALAVTVSLAGLGCGKPDNSSPPAQTPVKVDLQKLAGNWLRPDGEYRLEIKTVAPDGTLDAAYFNPNPIKVSAAKATVEGGAAKVFVELRDTGYPGCNYTLTYDALEDQLKGVYFQAAMQQRYEIFFVRMK